MKDVKNRDELEKYIRSKVVKDKISKNDVADKAKEKYDIPLEISMDILSFRRNMGEFRLFVLYALLDSMSPEKIREYFTDDDISVFSREKYETKKIRFPYVFKNMVKVNDDQWIGCISVKELMLLKDGGYINYRDETQRRLKKIVYKDREFYEISIGSSTSPPSQRSCWTV